MTAVSGNEKAATALDFSAGSSTDVDAVVIGAGFSGLRALIELRHLGLSAELIEAGSDVGGTWYWNRYPGARTDSQAWVYGFPLEKMRGDWRWEERFATQPQTHGYIRQVADAYELWPHITFETRVTSAVFDEEAEVWRVSTDTNREISTRFLITATGQLSLPYFPDFEGLADFKGQWYQTQRWPEGGVDLSGKRVAVVGTGATAVQVIPIVAEQADHLTVVQRTPNYVLPARNDRVSEHDLKTLRRDYDEIIERAFDQPFGMDIQGAAGSSTDFTPEEQQQILERGWESGGFKFLFETFDDVLVSDAANELVADFHRKKIRAIVHDPATADLLSPKDYPFAGKRPPLGHYYYETFNRDNVDLVDISQTPLQIEPDGIRVGDVFHEVDVIIFATGYDALTGTLNQIDIRGRGGVGLKDRWTEGPATFLGMFVDGFPNLIMVAGPQTPFANIPVVAEYNVRYIGRLLTAMHERGASEVEPTSEAVEGFSQLTEAVLDATVLRKHAKPSWFIGTNVPGKPARAVMWLAGFPTYRDVCAAAENDGYQGLELKTPAAATAT